MTNRLIVAVGWAAPDGPAAVKGKAVATAAPSCPVQSGGRRLSPWQNRGCSSGGSCSQAVSGWGAQRHEPLKESGGQVLGRIQSGSQDP